MTMDLREARVRAMVDPKSEGWARSLNDADRAAIGWLFDEVFKARDEADEVRRENMLLLEQSIRARGIIAQSRELLRKAIAD